MIPIDPPAILRRIVYLQSRISSLEQRLAELENEPNEVVHLLRGYDREDRIWILTHWCLHCYRDMDPDDIHDICYCTNDE